MLPRPKRVALKRVSSRELIAAFRRIGFEVVATRGSHAKLRRILPDGSRQALTIPLHRELALGTLQAIFRQARRFASEETLRPHFFGE